jgi:hypothetical protein
LKYKLIILILLCFNLLAQNTEWGWETHRYINEHAVDYLPAEMSFFQDHRQFLREHSVDPDTDPLPGFYHYMDIDYYPAFFSGTLPHNWNDMIATYGLSTVEDNGIVPWVIEWWTDSLSTLMASGQWNNAWQVAAELGHYVADSHQPLHLTMNYNGQLTGNYGIHSRYETSMINPHLSQLPLTTGTGRYWTNVIDSVFLAIEEVYPYVDSIMTADDLAYAQDPNYGSTYYNILWQELEHLTTVSIHKSILDLASIWRTAWVNAGSPSPLGIDENNQNPVRFLLAKAYPNPFNPRTNIQFTIPKSEFLTLKIYNLLGQEVETLVSENLAAGEYKSTWDASDFASGIYYYKIVAGSNIQTHKLILMK